MPLYHCTAFTPECIMIFARFHWQIPPTKRPMLPQNPRAFTQNPRLETSFLDKGMKPAERLMLAGIAAHQTYNLQYLQSSRHDTCKILSQLVSVCGYSPAPASPAMYIYSSQHCTVQQCTVQQCTAMHTLAERMTSQVCKKVHCTAQLSSTQLLQPSTAQQDAHAAAAPIAAVRLLTSVGTMAVLPNQEYTTYQKQCWRQNIREVDDCNLHARSTSGMPCSVQLRCPTWLRHAPFSQEAASCKQRSTMVEHIQSDRHHAPRHGM